MTIGFPPYLNTLNAVATCWSRILAVYNSEFMLGSECVSSEYYCDTTKSISQFEFPNVVQALTWALYAHRCQGLISGHYYQF